MGIFGVLPRLGGLTRDAAGLRQCPLRPARRGGRGAAISLGCYALLYRQVLAALRARVRFRLAADVVLATFFVSHLTPFRSAAGTLVNVNRLESEGVDAATTGEAIGLTSLVSTVALIALFGIGFVATAGRHVSHTYLTIAASRSARWRRCSPPCWASRFRFMVMLGGGADILGAVVVPGGGNGAWPELARWPDL